MTKPKGNARSAILQAAEKLVCERGRTRVTIEQVAQTANSAKGLVHYHFKTKKGLLAAVAERIAQERSERWSELLKAENPSEAIDATWSHLTAESTSGVTRAWLSLLGPESPVADHMVRKLRGDFVSRLTDALVAMLETGMGLRPTIPNEEIGWLLASVIDGMTFELVSGTDPDELRGAYAAAWVGILALTDSL
ncbi:MAG: TetR/AcrR family transcriptional regulator [Gemmatimonadales bacterium]